MTFPTLLCVGSGLTPRYKLNTLQALAMPLGARIQFRYIARLIPDGLKKKLDGNAFKGATVLLGYVDCTAAARRPDNRCDILPYRYAELVSSRKVGSVYILQLEVGDFAISSDLEAFQRNLTGDVPEWGVDNKLKGAWCNELPTDFKEVRPTTSLADWEVIVKQIRQREDFSKVAYFCTIEGLFERTTGKRLVLSNGEYVLRSNKDYELRIFHFDPDSDAHTGYKQTRWLRLSVIGPWLRFPTNPLLAIDSPYDVKSIHLISGSTARQQYSSLVLKDEATTAANNTINSEQSLEMYLPVRIKGTVWQTSLYGLVVGTLLASQQLLVLFSQPVITNPIRITIATMVLGLGTGFVVAFGLSKPV
jgi:hypothetical protein